MSLDETLVAEAIKITRRTYGVIHQSIPAVMNGHKGFLIWDYILYNELTFLNAENGEIKSLYHSFSNRKMEEKYNEFKVRFGA